MQAEVSLQEEKGVRLLCKGGDGVVCIDDRCSVYAVDNKGGIGNSHRF